MTAILPYVLERSVTIGASRDTVFRFFTDSARWAVWWGAGSTIDPRPGGRVFIRYANGVEASGEVLEISPPDRIVFTFGYASGKPMPAGSSRVTIRLADHEEGTRLILTHELPDESARDQHVQGWRYQLSLFANVVADEAFAHAAHAIDAWFDAWAVEDEAMREGALSVIADRDVRYRDRFSSIAGLSELIPHVGAAQRFMPGLKFQRKSDVRHCQGVVLTDWVAVAADGSQRAAGTGVFAFNAAGLIQTATVFWS